MKRNDFMNKLAGAIQVSELTENTDLLELDEWDSIALTSVLVCFDEHLGLHVGIDKIRNCNTVSELLDLGKDFYE